ncbi:hypothetical protein PFISCL1PPCAC_13149, partial [Pristionchus fissidentatus]
RLDSNEGARSASSRRRRCLRCRDAPEEAVGVLRLRIPRSHLRRRLRPIRSIHRLRTGRLLCLRLRLPRLRNLWSYAHQEALRRREHPLQATSRLRRLPRLRLRIRLRIRPERLRIPLCLRRVPRNLRLRSIPRLRRRCLRQEVNHMPGPNMICSRFEISRLTSFAHLFPIENDVYKRFELK